MAKSRRTFWFFFEIKALQHGIRATNFSLFNQQETVFLVIGFPVCSQDAREIDIAVSKRSFIDILIIIRFFHWVVIGGLPVLDFGSSVSIYWLHYKQRYLTFVWYQKFQNTVYLLHDLLKWAFFLLELNNYVLSPPSCLKNSSNDVWQSTINQN